MDDLRILLQALLNQGDSEAAAYLNDPSSRPEVGRGRPIPTYRAELPQQRYWPRASQPEPRAEPEYLVGPGAERVPLPAPRALRVRPLAPENPGNYANFADYANAVEGLRVPTPPPDREQWRSPIATDRMGVGDPALRRGMDPPDAPRGRTTAEIENEAWRNAMARARVQVRADTRRQGRRIPRPGNPAIAQAWSSDDR